MPPPEDTTASERLIADFEGAVQIAAASPAVNCRLKGVERGSGVALEVHFSGASGMSAAHTLGDLKVFEISTGEAHEWKVLAGDQHYLVCARAVQVHRMPAAAFYGALPGEPLRLTTRAGWALLLNFLRIPGAARLISSIRSSRA